MSVNKGVAVIATSFLGAIVVGLFGDFLVYEEEGEGIGFEEGSTGAEIVEIAPALLVVFGLYAGYRHMTPEDE